MVCYNPIGSQDMLRIIYFKGETGYCLSDMIINKELDLKLDSLARYDAEIICIFEVGLNSILYKCSSFDVHIQTIKVSYPSSFRGKILNMLSANRKPSYSQITALEKQSKIITAPALNGIPFPSKYTYPKILTT